MVARRNPSVRQRTGDSNLHSLLVLCKAGVARSHSHATYVATGYRPRSVVASDSRSAHDPTNTQCGWGRGARTGLEKGPTRRSARRPRKQTDPRWTANASPSGVRCRGGRATDLTAAHAHGGAPGIVVVIGHDPHRIFREPLAARSGGRPVARPGSGQGASAGAPAPRDAADPDGGGSRRRGGTRGPGGTCHHCTRATSTQ